jgi:hypothetical protein
MYFGNVSFGAAMREEDRRPAGSGSSETGRSTGAASGGSSSDTVVERAAAQRQAAAAAAKDKRAIRARAEEAKLRSADIVALRNELARTEAALAAKRTARSKSGLTVVKADLLDAEIFALTKQRDSLLAQIAKVQAQIDKDAAAAIAKAAYLAHLTAQRSGGGDGLSGGTSMSLGTGSTSPATSGGPTGSTAGPSSTETQPFGPGTTSNAIPISFTAAEQAEREAKVAEERESAANQAALQAQADAEAAAADLADKQAAAEAEAQAQIDAARTAAERAAAQAELDRIKAGSIAKSSGGSAIAVGIALAVKLLFF